ncbi:TVP38/TMEM64 family protein [Geodermatophilus sp. SYSU D00758]
MSPARPDLDRALRLLQGPWVRLALLGVLLAVAVVLALTVDRPGVPAVRGWLDAAGPGSWTLLVLATSLAMLVPVPRTAVSVLLGAAAGFPAGLAVAVAGGFLGGVAGFGLSRVLGRDAVARVAGRRLDRAERLLADRGFLAVLTARVSPLPFVLTSYAAGLTGLRWRPYVLGTAVGVVPGSVLHVAVGASLITWL